RRNRRSSRRSGQRGHLRAAFGALGRFVELAFVVVALVVIVLDEDLLLVVVGLFLLVLFDGLELLLLRRPAGGARGHFARLRLPRAALRLLLAPERHLRGLRPTAGCPETSQEQDEPKRTRVPEARHGAIIGRAAQQGLWFFGGPTRSVTPGRAPP